MNIPENYKETKIDISKLEAVDKHLLTKLENTIEKVTKAMDAYDYGVASSVLYNFVYDDFCSNYLEMTKVTLKNENSYKEGTYFTLIKALKAILMMIYPFSPFIAEEIYLNLPEHLDSIMLESYPEFEEKYIFEEDEAKVNIIYELIESIRQYKVQNELAPNYSLDLALKSEIDLSDLYPYLTRFAFAKSLKETNEEVKNATSIILPKVSLYIFDGIDKEELKNKLLKEVESIKNEIKRSEGMLNNKNFLDKAPEAKVK